jgi:hypothetical protein
MQAFAENLGFLIDARQQIVEFSGPGYGVSIGVQF